VAGCALHRCRLRFQSLPASLEEALASGEWRAKLGEKRLQKSLILLIRNGRSSPLPRSQVADWVTVVCLRVWPPVLSSIPSLEIVFVYCSCLFQFSWCLVLIIPAASSFLDDDNRLRQPVARGQVRSTQYVHSRTPVSSFPSRPRPTETPSPNTSCTTPSSRDIVCVSFFFIIFLSPRNKISISISNHLSDVVPSFSSATPPTVS